jgi:diacylglycerol kinase family enzyme
VRIAVVVNESARRGSGAVAGVARRELPSARVLLSRSLHELEGFAEELVSDPPDLVLSAGGDGTAIALLNALRRAGKPTKSVVSDVTSELRPRALRPRLGPPIGVLKLGTGNAWARVTGSPPWKSAFALLRSLLAANAAPPLRSYDLIDVEGQVAHFTGTGWDAELVDDFHAQKTGAGILPPGRRHGLLGYLHALMTRTVPRNLTTPQAEVEIVNSGAEAMTVDALGAPVRMNGMSAGRVLYSGPTSVCAAGTTPEWGFGFRAFPFAGKVEGRFSLHNYNAGALEALMHSPGLWRGTHPMPKMDSWFLTRARLNFSRKVPFQIGGDLLGHRDSIEYVIAPEHVELVDWTSLARGVRGTHGHRKRDRIAQILIPAELR